MRKDSQFKKLGLDEADYVEAGPVIDLLVAKPRLLQRPIVVRGDKAIIGRPEGPHPRAAQLMASDPE